MRLCDLIPGASAPADHPHHLGCEARDAVFARAIAGMERRCDAMIETVLRELDAEAPADMWER